MKANEIPSYIKHVYGHSISYQLVKDWISGKGGKNRKGEPVWLRAKQISNLLMVYKADIQAFLDE